ncbi:MULTISPECIES: flagellar basal body rod protein FlgC [unclassified Nitratiruptor]|uniref:flagellar basal body rod protein FlgC n=1 Tax=unclassified Nitratiruptor TaxID=2624044 RepID=UPI0019156214|nr:MULTISPECIES: flagellar basal body rod protein FlgC [unclassified Nitratiruptor]BCD59922.1 flagellar basal-body rod protein FlgC [Nitratiruptor sp. YY08-10]BCD63845.1 flagellar basal-body rod protein FlgC [Nitratiruptor sp. YY08-14]
MIFKGLEVSQTGLSVQKYRMDIVASNMANANSIDDNGIPYRRKVPIFQEILDKEQNKIPLSKVAIKQVVEDPSPFKLKYDPNNPLADANGYVQLPNVDPLREMVDMISAMRTYEANLTAFNTHKDMLLKTIDILKV